MKNPNIALVLKKYRKLRNFTVQQVADVLAEYGYHFAPKTIYGWENGATQPDADTLMFLCELYEINDVLSVFGYKEPAEEALILTSLEKELIKKFRSKLEMRSAVMKLLDIKPEINYLELTTTKPRAVAEESNWNFKEK